MYILFFTGCALKCEMCLSAYGWDDCKNKVKTLFCSSHDNRCGKAVMEMKRFGRATEFYGKSCTTLEECSQRKCDSLKMGSSSTVTKCDIHCCNGDMCNGAQVSMVSTILLLACSILAFVKCQF